jgi:hypothetical protein
MLPAVENDDILRAKLDSNNRPIRFGPFVEPKIELLDSHR